mmetsp:Transcript_4162/g.7050  ORF Transcript_4162/g.7050 Transcript_4162/m.7050 type:complete len:82 (+) Transcript_4162:634-879(+)
MKSSAGGKAVDFYSGLKLDQGPLNPGRKTWAMAVKEQQLEEEMGAVNSLRDWEQSTLRDVDPKYVEEVDSEEEKEKEEAKE